MSHFTTDSTPAHTPESALREPSEAGPPRLLLLLMLAAFVALPTLAQEVWIRPMHACSPGTSGDSSCLFASTPMDDSSGPGGVPDGLDDDNLRNDFLDQLTDDDGQTPPTPTHWPELRAMVDSFAFYNFLFSEKKTQIPGYIYQVSPYLEESPVNEVALLADMIAEQALPVVLEVGGPRAPAFLQDCTQIAESTVAREIKEIQRWADRNAGRVDVLVMDHPVLFLINAYNAGRCTSQLATMDQLFALVGKYMELMKSELDAIGQTGVEFAYFGGPSGFDITTASGLVYPANSSTFTSYITSTNTPDYYTDFDAFIQVLYNKTCIKSGMTCTRRLSHFLLDQAPQVPLNDATTNDPWDFGRIVAAEAQIKETGLESGFNYAPGRCFIGQTSGGHAECTGFASGNRGAYEIVRQFAEQYRADGGNADVLGLFSWHFYPTDTGPESGGHTFMAMARDTLVLDEQIRDRTIVSPYTGDGFTTIDSQRWDFEVPAGSTLESEWTISSGRLERLTSTSAAAELRDEKVSDFAAEIRLEHTSTSFQDWLALHFRMAAPGDRVWESGYAVVLRGNGKLQLLEDGVVLEQTVAGAYPPADGVDLRVEAIGSQIRVFADSVRVLTADTGTYASGYLSLANFGTGGFFDDFALARYATENAGFSDDFADGVLLDDWRLATGDRGTWGLDAGAAYQSDATGQAYLHRADGATFSDFRLKAKVRLDGCTGADSWAGLYFRKGDADAKFWQDGFTVRLYDDDLRLYLTNQAFVPAAGDLGLDASAQIELDVVALGDRLVVRIDGAEVLNAELPTDLPDPGNSPVASTTGELGLAMYDCAAWFDEVVLTELGG